MRTILITSPLAKRERIQRRLREAGYGIRLEDLGMTPTEETVISALRGADGVIASVERYTKRVLENATQLRVIARTGVGFDSIDLDAATDRGIAVCTAIGANEQTVADFAMTLMLGLARQVVHLHDALWHQDRFQAVPAIDFFGKTVGVVGTGAIGTHVIRRVRAFDCPVLAYDVAPDPTLATSRSVRYVSLETLMRQADFVTVHLPLSPATRHLIGARELALMQPTAFLVNTARGPIVDEDALYRALVERRIAGAGLDVFHKEPLQPDNRLRTLHNVILTPHAAGITVEAAQRAAEIAADNVHRVLAKRSPSSCVNPEALVQ